MGSIRLRGPGDRHVLCNLVKEPLEYGLGSQWVGYVPKDEFIVSSWEM